jgi:hypothetical protein
VVSFLWPKSSIKFDKGISAYADVLKGHGLNRAAKAATTSRALTREGTQNRNTAITGTDHCSLFTDH